MNRQYIIEILLRAREEISKVAQRAASAIQGVTQAQNEHTQASQQATKASQEHVKAIDHLVEAHTREKKGAKEAAAELRQQAQVRRSLIQQLQEHINKINEQVRTERAAAAERKSQHVETVANLRAQAAARENAIGKVDAEVKAIRRLANERQTAAEAEAASSRRNVDVLGRELAAHRNLADTYKREAAQLDSLAASQENNRRGILGFFRGVREGANDSNADLARLAATFRGFQIAFVIKYAQALISAFVALGATLVSVASSAIMAGSALAGALAAGMAQAIPLVGAFIAVLARVTAVMKAVNQEQQNRLTAAREDEAASERQRSAAERIRNAQEALRDSNRRVADTIRDLTRARREAREEAEQTIRTEQRANLAYSDAQIALRQAIATGDAGAVAEAQLDVGDARERARQAQRDAGVARRTGMSPAGVERVAQAERALADTQQTSARASRDLADARTDASTALAKEAAGVDKLQSMLDQLSPAELAMYRSIVRIRGTFEREVRPITDIIIRAFTRGIDRANELLQDDRVLTGFRRVARAISRSFNSLTDFGSGDRSVNFFSFLTREIERNEPIVTRILVNLMKIFENLARAGAPAFREILRFVVRLTSSAEEATGPTKRLSDFFMDGVRHLKAWVFFGAAVVDIIAALVGVSSESGLRGIRDATEWLHEMADEIRNNRVEVSQFFEDARGATGAVLRVIGALGEEAIRVFSPGNVKAFADFIIAVLIPAVGSVIEIMGFLTTIVHRLLSLPLVSEIAQWVATFVILTRGLMILRNAVTLIALAARAFFLTFGIIPTIIAAVVAAIVLLDRRFHFLAPTFKWLKEAAADVFRFLRRQAMVVVDWFKDVWNQGLLKWIRFPFVWIAENISFPIWRQILKAARSVINFFDGEDSPWGGIAKVFTIPFDIAWGAIKIVLDIMRTGFNVFLDLVSGRFDRIGKRISSLWQSVFGTMYEVVASVLNKIIGGVNAAIGAFNKLPGPNIGKIDFRMAENWEAAKTLSKAERGERTSNYEGPHATGGMLRAAPGGKLITVAEGGFDEVVLTTDPKYAGRQKELLLDYLKKMAPHFARGGYVQGAQVPPGGTPPLIRRLLNAGFNVTSAYRPGSMTNSGNVSDHSAGNAWDFGDSVNNLRRLWRNLIPVMNQIKQLFGPTYVSGGFGFNYGRSFDQRGTANQRIHEDHIHVALGGVRQLARNIGAFVGNVAGGNVGALVAQLPQVLQGAQSNFPGWIRGLIGRDPRNRGGLAASGLGGVWRLARGALREISQRAQDVAGMAGPGGGPGLDASSQDVARTVFRVGRSVGAPFKHLLAAFMTGIVESGFRNLPGGDRDSAGWRQERASLYPNPTNVVASARRFFREARDLDRGQSAGALAADVQRPAEQYRGRYQDVYDRALALLRRIRRMRGFMSGGAIPGFGGGDQWPILAEGGEHIFTKDEVRSAGGHGVLASLRRMLGGGGQGGPGGYQDGGEVARIQGQIFAGLSAGAGSRRLVQVRAAFESVFGDNGLFAQMTAAISEIVTRGQRAIQRSLYVIGRDGSIRRRNVSEARKAVREIGTLRDSREGLEQQGDILEQAEGTARQRLALARQQGNRRLAQQMRAEINRINRLQEENRQALTDNAQALVEAQERFQQALYDSAQDRANQANNALEQWSRRLAAFGRTVDPAELARQRIAIMQRQHGELADVLERATRTGNRTLADQTREQMEELVTAVAEAQAEIFQASIDAVNTRAADQLVRNDLIMRVAEIGGTNFAVKGRALTDRRAILSQQYRALVGLRDQASAEGRLDQVRALTQSIDALAVDLQENSQAIRDNTNAAFAKRVEDINSAFSFISGALGQAGTFFQGLQSLTGQSTTATQLGLAQSTGAALATQRTGLLGALESLLGYGSGELSGLEGADLVNTLLTMIQGPVYQSILDRLDTTQEGQFQELINALLGNASATVDNTKAIQELAGQSDAASYSSSFWETFRHAIFTGGGQLMPQYAAYAPAMTSSRMAATVAGVTQGSSIEARAANGLVVHGDYIAGDHTDHWDIDTPKEVVDGTSLARETSWARRYSPTGSRGR